MGSLRRLCQNFEIGNFSSQRNLALTDFYKRKKTTTTTTTTTTTKQYTGTATVKK